ncbi:MAG: cobalamin-dependent protein [Planctomycetota bacterium]|jgi:hypothetical protein
MVLAATRTTGTGVRSVLVQTYHPYTQFTHVHPLGIMMIAAAARARGHEDVHILDMKVEDWSPEQCVEALEKLQPDVIGLSAMTYEAGCMHDLAKLIKQPRSSAAARTPAWRPTT